MMGIGAAHMKDPNGIAWKQNRDFENLLKRLNESSEGEVKVDPEVTTVEVEVVAEAEAVVGEEEKEEKKEKKKKKEKEKKEKKDKESKKEKKRKLEEEGGKEKKKRRRSSEEPQEEDVQMKEPSPPPPAPALKPVHRFRSYVPPHFEAQSRKLIPFFLQTSSSSYRSQKHFLKIISSHLRNSGYRTNSFYIIPVRIWFSHTCRGQTHADIRRSRARKDHDVHQERRRLLQRKIIVKELLKVGITSRNFDSRLIGCKPRQRL
jgi:flagellar biosynthesis GTPase FlhF